MRHPNQAQGSGRMQVSETRNSEGALRPDLIRREGPVSCADLARQIGLTKATGLQDLSTQTNDPPIIHFSLHLGW